MNYYGILTTLRDKILDIGITKTVTQGDLSKVDIQKMTIFPLAHLLVNSMVQADNVLRYNVTVLCLDIVNSYNEPVEDLLRGNDNEQDVLNTQAFILNLLIQELRKGDLYSDNFQIEGEVPITFFIDRFENNLAGAEATFDIIIPNEISIC